MRTKPHSIEPFNFCYIHLRVYTKLLMSLLFGHPHSLLGLQPNPIDSDDVSY
jgi:hypothetical protein